MHGHTIHLRYKDVYAKLLSASTISSWLFYIEIREKKSLSTLGYRNMTDLRYADGLDV